MTKYILIFLLLTAVTYAQSGKSVLSPAQKDSIAAMISDSLENYDLTNYVDKTTPQTITGQKNFMGTVKVGSDTTMRLGYLDGSYRTGVTINTSASHPYGFNRIFKVIPYSSNTAPWVMATGEADFLPDSAGVDHTLNIGSNWDGNLQLPQFGVQFENNYEFSDSGSAAEYFSYYNDLPSPNTTYSVRPFQLGVEKYESGRFRTAFSFSVDRLIIGGTDYLDDRFDFQPMSSAFAGKHGAFFMNDSSFIKNNVNNFGWLYQASNDNSSIELMRVDNNNRIVISPYNTTQTIIGSDGGLSTNSIEIKSIPLDTTGLGVGQIYLKNDGSINYTIPFNILTNGDFTDWSGILLQRKPDNFYSTYDTTKAYVEESPSGQLHYINDGTDTGALTSNDSTEVGKTYGYSFTVTQIVDSTLIYIGDNGFIPTEVGVYSGVTREIGLATNLFALLKGDLVGASEITLDNIRIWDMSSTSRQLTYDFRNAPINLLSPTTSDTLFLGYKINGAFYDSLMIVDIVDSIAIQGWYDDGSVHNLITTVDTLTSDATIIFDNGTIPDGAKVYLYFVYLGDSEAWLRSQIYWRE